MSAEKYRKKPVEIEAIQFDGTNVMELIEWVGGSARYSGLDSFSELLIQTLEGEMHASLGDWIIKGTEGEFYPCKPAAFAATFEKVES